MKLQKAKSIINQYEAVLKLLEEHRAERATIANSIAPLEEAVNECAARLELAEAAESLILDKIQELKNDLIDARANVAEAVHDVSVARRDAQEASTNLGSNLSTIDSAIHHIKLRISFYAKNLQEAKDTVRRMEILPAAKAEAIKKAVELGMKSLPGASVEQFAEVFTSVCTLGQLECLVAGIAIPGGEELEVPGRLTLTERVEQAAKLMRVPAVDNGMREGVLPNTISQAPSTDLLKGGRKGH